MLGGGDGCFGSAMVKAMTTMGMRLQKLRAGAHTRARRHTGSKLYYVVRGRGTTVVDGPVLLVESRPKARLELPAEPKLI